jgi:hypothetical protein
MALCSHLLVDEHRCPAPDTRPFIAALNVSYSSPENMDQLITGLFLSHHVAVDRAYTTKLTSTNTLANSLLIPVYWNIR